MRRLALVFALLTSASAFAEITNIMVRDGDSSYINGSSRMRQHLSGYGKRFAYFEQNGAGYVITDAAALDRIDAVLEPQRVIGQRQAALGQDQAALGQEQALLGQEQAKLGLQQAALATRQIGARDDQARALSARQRELSEKQRELGNEQRVLGDRQRLLGDRQRVLGEQQREASRKVEVKLEEIFDAAIRNKIAVRHRD